MRKGQIVVVTALMLAAPARADWNPGDGHKMHSPQMPDPNGWDVNDSLLFGADGAPVADDWLCPETGPVTAIHFWGSWKGNNRYEIIDLLVRIWADDPSGAFPMPDRSQALWTRQYLPGEFSERHAGTGDQGWYTPGGDAVPHDHSDYYQYNIEDIDEPFVQQQGTNYWLQITVSTSDGEFGWKTSLDHFRADAVWDDFAAPSPGWQELLDPITQESLDMAFVIAPEPGTLSLLALAGLVAIRSGPRRRG